MAEATTLSAVRPAPAGALQAAFESVRQGPMRDVPMLNPKIGVEAVGFRPWSEHWLGILITPWFMNLVLMPRVIAEWQPIGVGETRCHVFPAGVFEFIGGHEPSLGDYQACSLFSPMFEFADHAAAHATAQAALAALFDVTSREHDAVPTMPLGAGATGATGADVPGGPLSKRDFLFGSPARAGREP